MASEFRHPMQVQFADTDMAGIVHFTRFFHYMETAEHAFLRSLRIPIHHTANGRTLSWPRGSVACSYKAPLRFEDDFEVHVLVREVGRCTITYEFRFLKDSTQLVAEGTVTTICAQLDQASGSIAAIAIPEEIRECLELAPTELMSE